MTIECSNNFEIRNIQDSIIQNYSMDRRKILKYVAYATGAAVAAPLANSLLVSCQSEAAKTAGNVAKSGLSFFKPKEFATIKEMVDIILPKTDSPSATEVGVHEMIEHMVGNAYRPDARKAYQEKFAAFYKYLGENNYGDLDGVGKMDLLTTLDKSTDDVSKAARSGYLNLKQQTIAYYLTSEEVGTKFLNYLPVPGEYEPCISLEETGGKAWAL